MKKYLWVIPGMAGSGSAAALIACCLRNVPAMVGFWFFATLILIILTIQVATEEV